MKMKKDDYETLRTGLLDTLAEFNLQPSQIGSNYERWNVLHMARQKGRVNLIELYRDYNDQHIETAMKDIFK
jgi:hypothetical protein